MADEKFEFAVACPMHEVQGGLRAWNLAEEERRRLGNTDDAIHAGLYERLEGDVNKAVRENGLDILHQPGSSIPITTSIITRYDGIPIIVSLQRIDSVKWRAVICDTPLSQFAFCPKHAYAMLQQIANKDHRHFTRFFNEACTREMLHAFRRSQTEGILLPAGCLDRNGQYPVFAQFSRNQRTAFPPYVLNFFCRSMANPHSARASAVFINQRYVEDAKLRSSSPDLPGQIEKAFDSLPQGDWDRVLKEAEGRAITPTEIFWPGGAFALTLRPNGWRVVREFGVDDHGRPWLVPAIMLQLFEKRTATLPRTEDTAQSQPNNKRDLVEKQVEWHTDLLGDLALLLNEESTVIDFVDLLCKQDIEKLLQRSHSAPAWFDTSLTVKTSYGRYTVWGRLDFNPLSPKPYALRCFSPVPPSHPLNSFATYFIAPFSDLRNMLSFNKDTPETRTIAELMIEFAGQFKNGQREASLATHLDEPNVAYCVDTRFTIPGTGKGKKQPIAAYFGPCAYYKGQATPYFLKFFYLEEIPKRDHVASKIQRSIEYLVIGDKIQDWRRQSPNPLAALKYFESREISPDAKEMFDILLLLQKKSDVMNLRHAIQTQKSQQLQDDLLRKLLHKIRHTTVAIQSLSEDIQRTGNTGYAGRIVSQAASLNKSVELFRYTTTDKDELRASFNRGLLYFDPAAESKTEHRHLQPFTNLLAQAISEALNSLVTESDEERFRQVISAYMKARFLPNAWPAAADSERQAALESYKKVLLSRYPKAEADIRAETLDSLEPADHFAMQAAWALHLLRSECERQRGAATLNGLKTILETFFFRSVSFSEANSAFFDPNEPLAQFLLTDILTEMLFNALKYGAPGGTLKVACLMQPNHFTLHIENDINPNRRTLGSGSGLKGCIGLVDMLGGTFVSQTTTGEDNGQTAPAKFITRMDIPLESTTDTLTSPVAMGRI